MVINAAMISPALRPSTSVGGEWSTGITPPTLMQIAYAAFVSEALKPDDDDRFTERPRTHQTEIDMPSSPHSSDLR